MVNRCGGGCADGILTSLDLVGQGGHVERTEHELLPAYGFDVGEHDEILGEPDDVVALRILFLLVAQRDHADDVFVAVDHRHPGALGDVAAVLHEKAHLAAALRDLLEPLVLVIALALGLYGPFLFPKVGERVVRELHRIHYPRLGEIMVEELREDGHRIGMPGLCIYRYLQVSTRELEYQSNSSESIEKRPRSIIRRNR